jgi:hypothetical protein
VAAAAIALAAIPSIANASTWGVAHPPDTATDNVPYVPLNAITAISSTNVWAVGQDSGSPQIDHWNGSRWSQSALPSGECSVFENSCVLNGVSGDSASDVIAVGDGVINSDSSAGWAAEALAFRWNGTAWQQLTVPGSVPEDAMEHVQAFSPANAWAVGVGTSATSGAAVATALNWNGTPWTQVTDNSGLLDVDAVSPTDAWAIAADGSVLDWNGTAWSVATQLAEGNTAIAALSRTDVWVAGVVSLSHYNGTSWTSTSIPAGVNALTGHAVLSPSDIWFAGYYYPSNAVTAPAVLSTSSG